MKTIQIAVLTIALVFTQINHQFAQCESAAKGKVVHAVNYNGEWIPSINLGIIEITAERKKTTHAVVSDPNEIKCNLPVVEITASRINCNLLPTAKYNGEWIAVKTLPEVDIFPQDKKLSVASIFSFGWLKKNIFTGKGKTLNY